MTSLQDPCSDTDWRTCHAITIFICHTQYNVFYTEEANVTKGDGAVRKKKTLDQLDSAYEAQRNRYNLVQLCYCSEQTTGWMTGRSGIDLGGGTDCFLLSKVLATSSIVTRRFYTRIEKGTKLTIYRDVEIRVCLSLVIIFDGARGGAVG